MTESFAPGLYKIVTELDYLEIRAARSSTSPSRGRYYKNDTFPIYKVFPEMGGIIWGAASSNPVESIAVGMRVSNHDKVIFIAPLPGTPDSADTDVVAALKENTAALRENTAALLGRRP